MTEAMQNAADLLTAAAALGAFALNAWNAYPFGKLTATVRSEVSDQAGGPA